MLGFAVRKEVEMAKDTNIISDEDWKNQAKKEKEKLADGKKEDKTASSEAAGRGPLPEASFMTLANSLVMQAMFALGRFGMEQGQEPKVDLDMAKFQIDTLQVLADKTKGNLTDEENKMLVSTLHELRMQYVQVAK